MSNHYTILFSFLLALSCNGNKQKEDTLYKQGLAKENAITNMKAEEIITKEKLKKATQNEALKKFGNPIAERKFTLGEDSSEFTISLRNYFTKEELLGKSIPITEMTWKLDKDNKITAWYRSDKQDKPIDVYVWNKDAEF